MTTALYLEFACLALVNRLAEVLRKWSPQMDFESASVRTAPMIIWRLRECIPPPDWQDPVEEDPEVVLDDPFDVSPVTDPGPILLIASRTRRSSTGCITIIDWKRRQRSDGTYFLRTTKAQSIYCKLPSTSSSSKCRDGSWRSTIAAPSSFGDHVACT